MNIIAIEVSLTRVEYFFTRHIEIYTDVLPQPGVCFPFYWNTCTGSRDASLSVYSIESFTLSFSSRCV